MSTSLILFEPLTIAISDETTSLTTGPAKVTFRIPVAAIITDIQASVTTAPTGSALIFDINKNNSSILSTKLSIDAGQKVSTTSSVPRVIDNTVVAAWDEFTIDLDQVGSLLAGAGAKIYFMYVRL